MNRSVDVVVVGAGPAGLSLATRLRERGVARVLVVEREATAGGVPRHCVHPGFGARDLHRFLSGPSYARALVQRALATGVEIETSTFVTRVDPQGAQITSPAGISRVEARAVVLATGARERPRAARAVPGDRPAGVFTTGQLQQWTYLEKLPVGRRALVVGAEHVSFSAILTLRHAGVRTVALVTPLGRHQSVRGAQTLARAARVPVVTNTRVIEIIGRRRVQSVVLEDLATQKQWRESVDTVVFTGDWIPDNELARLAGVDIDVGTRGPATDVNGRTNIPSLYAAGNVMHPVESADVAALWARRVADTVARELVHQPTQSRPRVSLAVQDPLAWVWPNCLVVGEDIAHLRLRTRDFTTSTTLQALGASGDVLASGQIKRSTPHRSLRAPAAVRSALSRGDATLLRLA